MTPPISFVATAGLTKLTDLAFGMGNAMIMNTVRQYLPPKLVKEYEKALRMGNTKILTRLNQKIAEKMPGKEKITGTIGQELNSPYLKGIEKYLFESDSWAQSKHTQALQKRLNKTYEILYKYQRKSLGFDDVTDEATALKTSSRSSRSRRGNYNIIFWTRYIIRIRKKYGERARGIKFKIYF